MVSRKMSNAEYYNCDGSKCNELNHVPLSMESFDWSRMLDGNGNATTRDQLADIVVVFISKGWCKYCCQISPILNQIQQHNKDKFSLVILNHSFIEKPYQEEGFKTFMHDKQFYNMNYQPSTSQELIDFRLFLRDHAIEFPAFFVFDNVTGKIITNDGYNAIKSVCDLKADVGLFELCKEEFRTKVVGCWEDGLKA
ncbi:hypothetical protein BC833DRAFT_36277 [Globomyces pollinis-pini]|nr:hypothetical protein BC833DRAFT_36277 [Globomyces pollinis-pini]